MEVSMSVAEVIGGIIWEDSDYTTGLGLLADIIAQLEGRNVTFRERWVVVICDYSR